MYGLIGKMTAVSGQRDTLASAMLEGTTAMPGCLSYVIALDPADSDALWITEVWDMRESHAASLALSAVRPLPRLDRLSPASATGRKRRP